jgi:tetratricopeptide (TPR) repeat protein
LGLGEEIDRILEEATLSASRVELAAIRSASYARIAEACLKHGSIPICLEMLFKALEACEKIKYPEEKAKRLAWIARIYQELGDSAKAKEQFKRAVLLACAAETVSKKVGALYDLACEYADAGLNEEAEKTLETLHATVTIAQEEVDVVCELINIAGLYIDMNNIARAGAILKEALQITAQAQYTWFKIERGVEIAQAFASAGENDQSEIWLSESLANLNSVDKENRTYFNLKIADVFLTLGNHQSAIELLQKTAQEARENESNYAKAQSLTEIAEKYLQMDDGSAAIVILNTIAEAIEKIEDVKDKIAMLVKTADLLREAGQEEKALSLAEQSQILAESLIDAKSRVFSLGNVAVLWAKLQQREKVHAVVSRLQKLAQNTPVKTSGLGEIAAELAAAGETAPALVLARLIREPEIRVTALCRIVDMYI